jgi:hypothetical protein
MFEDPVLDRSACEPHSVGAVAIVEKDNLLHAFYTEFFEWIDVHGATRAFVSH